MHSSNEMARQAEKQLANTNAVKIQNMRKAAIAVNVLFILIRLVWYYGTTSKKTWFMYIVTNIAATLIQLQLENIGMPRFAEDGQLISAGEDLGQKGLTEYLFDIVYMTWIVYTLVAVITDYAWLMYLAIPVYATVKAWPLVRGMLGNVMDQARAQAAATQGGRQSDDNRASARAAGNEAEPLSKRQQKLQARQEKYSTVRMR